jgi:2'-5' RNA ligase
MGREGRRVRAFVAVEIPEAVRGALEDVAREVRAAWPGLRVIPAANIHVTLRFLGEIDRDQVGRIEPALARSLGDLAAGRFEVVGIGVFPDVRRPRVLWAGVGDGESLVRVAERVRQATLDLAPDEDRPFRAHATIGRFRGEAHRTALEPALEAHLGRRFGQVPLDEVVLMESLLGGPAPIYRGLARIRLGGSA